MEIIIFIFSFFYHFKFCIIFLTSNLMKRGIKVLKIFLCEDNDEQRARFEKIINNIIMIENYDMSLQVSSENPYDIINFIKENDTTGIYFLDVDLHSDINGIQLA